jgi:hypothetical protein
MEKRILVATVIVLAFGGLTQAQPPAQSSDVHGYLDLTWSSRYVWRGFEIYGDKTAIHPGVDLSLGDTGFGVNVTGHLPATGTQDFQRWDYTLYYQNSLFQGESYMTQYRLGWVYYNYPGKSAADYDLQEAQAIFSLPKLCPSGVIPSYALIKLWPSSSGSLVGARSTTDGTPTGPPSYGTASGFVHIFMLDYAWTIGAILPNTPEQVLNLHAEAVYNDGFGPKGQNVDHDWSNAVFGVSTDFELAQNVVLTPGVYEQVRMNSSVNTNKDETWMSLGLRYKF